MVINDIVKRKYKNYHAIVDLIRTKLPYFKINEDNIKTLLIEDMSLEQFNRTGFAGIYEYDINRIGVFTNIGPNGKKYYDEIDISEEELINTLVHEIIHACTTRKNSDGLTLQGLNMKNGNEDSILVSINEGITQMIADELLNSKSDAYPFLKCFAEQLRCIIGEEKLYEYYSNNDINGLVKNINSIFGNKIGESLFYEIYLFDLVQKGTLIEDGSFLGDIIQSKLIELYKRSGKNDKSFDDLIITNEKAREFASMLPRKVVNIEELGFKINDLNEGRGL